MIRVTLEIVGCDDCPFLRHRERLDGFDYFCAKAERPIVHDLKYRDITVARGLGKPVPDWCPFAVNLVDSAEGKE